MGVLLTVAMNLIRGSMLPLNWLEKVVSIIKVLLEQGDPFPERFDKSKSFRFLMCGTLLGGLVLSNAFKSTNVYNIVLPKQRLKFRTFNELLQHGYSVYSRMVVSDYYLTFAEDPLSPTNPEEYMGTMYIQTTKDSMIFAGVTEIKSYHKMILRSPNKIIGNQTNLADYLLNTTRAYYGWYEVVMEPFKVLRPLFQVGLITLGKFQSTADAVDLMKKQEKLIADDLGKCDKTAWVLPDYKAQQYARMLYKSSKHTDVGVDKYFRRNFNLVLRGSIPSPIIQRTSAVSSSGLLEWWSDLINRTDLVIQSETEPPTRPAMSGNIQVLFIVLGFGMLVAQIAFVLELHGYVWKFISYMYYLLTLLLKGLLKQSNFPSLRQVLLYKCCLSLKVGGLLHKWIKS